MPVVNSNNIEFSTLVTFGYILEAHYHHDKSLGRIVKGTTRTANGTLYHFRAFWAQERVVDAYLGNLPMRLSGSVRENDVLHLDPYSRIAA